MTLGFAAIKQKRKTKAAIGGSWNNDFENKDLSNYSESRLESDFGVRHSEARRAHDASCNNRRTAVYGREGKSFFIPPVSLTGRFGRPAWRSAAISRRPVRRDACFRERKKCRLPRRGARGAESGASENRVVVLRNGFGFFVSSNATRSRVVNGDDERTGAPHCRSSTLIEIKNEPKTV